MTPVALLSLAIFAPVLAGLAGMLLPRRRRGPRVLLAVLGPVASLALLGMYIGTSGLDGGPVGAAWMPQVHLDLAYNADRLGLFFALLVSGIGLLITLYARAYFGPDDDSLYRFYPSLHLFMTAMIGVALSDSFMLLLLFWEMTSISSFLLIGWERDDKDAVRNAMQAFVITGMGGLALMGGLILLGVLTGVWTFSGLEALSGGGGMPVGAVMNAAFALIFVGAAAKSAQWPLHFWLPGAMAAPTPVSAYLHSATMVKAGVYLIGRLWPSLSGLPLWPGLIVTIGAVTMLLGAYVALRKSDLKQIFAYTTVSQLGLLMCMYGLSAFRYAGEPNLVWDVTQILNHALYKAPLFIIAGAIAHVAHTRELPELRGFLRRGGSATVMAMTLILAAYAMAALPFTLSFPAKEFFFYQVYHGYEVSDSAAFYLLGAAGVATGALNMAIFVRLTRVMIGAPSAAAIPTPPVPPGHDVHGQHDYGAVDPARDHEHALGPHPERLPGHHERDAYHASPQDEHPHETGFWPAMLWLPAVLLVAIQFLGGIAPGAFEALFGPIERSRFYFEELPSSVELLTHPGVPLYMSLGGFALGAMLGFAPVLTSVIRDWHTGIYPAFYDLATRGGGRVFALVQTGHLRTYLAVVLTSLVFLVAWAVWHDPDARLALPGDIVIEPILALLPGLLLAMLVIIASVLMPVVRERASRILVLGTVGFSVTGLFYVYNAPDLALTQISIEIVSLILFLLVLALLPRTEPAAGRDRPPVAPRLVLAVAVGATMFWVTLTSAVGDRAPLPYLGADGRSFVHLGEFFLRNSYKGVDTPGLHPGGGGNNVVNVILVDFRGYDTLGEITVLGLAALGVWTLLRRPLRGGSYALRANLSEIRRTEAVRASGVPARDDEDAADVPAVERGEPS